MKKLVSLILALLMILSLASCSKKTEKKVVENPVKTVDLSKYSAEALYEYGANKMEALTSASYTTKLLCDGEEIASFETVRVRVGYDDFIYSRSGKGFFYSFDGERAYTKNEEGAFTAACNIRIFEEYLNEYVYPIYALEASSIENLQRDGDLVTYESTNEKLLSLYHFTGIDDFIPTALKGEAKLDKEGVIKEEKITLTGEEGTYELQTALTAYRSKDIAPAKPGDAEAYVEISDIRLPLRLQNALATLYQQELIGATVLSTKTAAVGEENVLKYVLTDFTTTFANAEKGEYYVSVQNKKQAPEVPQEEIFYQARLADGEKKENRYNAVTCELLWENTEKAKSLAWEDELDAVLLQLSDFATLSMTDEVGGYTITFTLTADAGKKLGGDIMSSFAALGLNAGGVTVRECTGTITIDRSLGMVTAYSYVIEGGFASEAGVGTYNGQYSILVDLKDDTLPELRVPTPTDVEAELEKEHDHGGC